MVNIRPYSQEDKDKINSIAIDAFLQFKEKYNDWEKMKLKVGNMASLDSTSDILVAEESNKIVGAVALVYPGKDINKNIELSWASIRMLVVSPEHRSKGIGTKLTMECIKLATVKGIKTIGLYTSTIMHVALPMYLRIGFVKVKNIESICGVEYALYKLKL